MENQPPLALQGRQSHMVAQALCDLAATGATADQISVTKDALVKALSELNALESSPSLFPVPNSPIAASS